MSNFTEVKIVDKVTGTAAVVNSDGQLHIVGRGKCDDNNSTVVLLDPAGVFTGVATDILDYSAITVAVGSNVAGTLAVQFSPNGTDWIDGESYDIIGGASKFFTPPAQLSYYRIVYTNGGTIQASFFIYACLKKQPIKWSSHNIDQAIVSQDDAQLTKSVITGKRADGIFANATLSNSDRLRVVSQSYGYAVAEGDITDHLVLSAVGERINLTTAPSDVWSGAATTIPIPPDAGDLISIVSTSIEDTLTTGTGAWTLNVDYITPAGDAATLTVDLTGTTIIDTGILMRYINNMHVVTVGTTGAAVGIITAYKTGTAGTVYRTILAGMNAELGCHKMISAGYKFYMTAWKAAVAGTGKSASMRLRGTFARDTGLITPRVFQHVDTVYLETSALRIPLDIPVVCPPLSIIKVTAQASQAGPYVSASFEGWIEAV